MRHLVRALTGVAMLALALWGVVASVSAHAHLVSSNPAAGARLTAPPTTVTITFDDNLDTVDTRITVLGPTGQTVSTGKTTVSASDAKVASVPMTGAGDGVYTVNWRSVADDDKGVVEDSFKFGVNAAAPTALPTTGGGGMAADRAMSPNLPVILALSLALVLIGGLTLRRRMH